MDFTSSAQTSSAPALCRVGNNETGRDDGRKHGDGGRDRMENTTVRVFFLFKKMVCGLMPCKRESVFMLMTVY